LKRHPALIPISREHHQLLLLAQLLKKDAPPYKGMPVDLEGKVKYAQAAWEGLIKPHIELEERVLFVTISGKTSSFSDLLNELRNEHELMTSMFKGLTPEIKQLDKLGQLIEQHVRKEERVLFQRVQELLTEEELDQLKTLLSAG
jgi:hemerythrin-like domain-containing protein